MMISDALRHAQQKHLVLDPLTSAIENWRHESLQFGKMMQTFATSDCD